MPNAPERPQDQAGPQRRIAALEQRQGNPAPADLLDRPYEQGGRK
jgi:hypothetical protein